MRTLLAVLVLGGGALLAAGQATRSVEGGGASDGGRTEPPRRSPEELIRHGEYLVHHVAMCVQCHSPRDSDGRLDERRLLRGAAMPLKSPWRNRDWAFECPDIAGLPGWDVNDAVQLLMTGKAPRGYTPRAPMPPFKMSREDATAVVAYLKSLH